MEEEEEEERRLRDVHLLATCVSLFASLSLSLSLSWKQMEGVCCQKEGRKEGRGYTQLEVAAACCLRRIKKFKKGAVGRSSMLSFSPPLPNMKCMAKTPSLSLSPISTPLFLLTLGA